MIEAKKEFIVKHREDVIDTLQLRAKERRVLYSLIVILFLTIAYENSNWLFARFFGDNFAAPAIGQRQKMILKTDSFLRLEKALSDVVEEYPQFWSHLRRQQQDLRDCMALTAEVANNNAAMIKASAVLNSLHEFVSLPVIVRSPTLEALAKELLKLSKGMKFSLKTEFELKPVVFRLEAKPTGVVGQRNLFEFSGR